MEEDKYYKFTALLIGFQYSTDDSIQSILIDLYRMYELLSPADSDVKPLIYVLTDVTSFSDTVVTSHIKNEVSEGVMKFLSTDEDRPENVSWIRIHDRKDMDNSWEKIDMEDTRFVVYYTGHCTKDKNKDMDLSIIRLPSEDQYPMKDLRDKIIDLTEPDSEICFIFDCCYSGGLGFPFRLNPKEEIFKLVDDENFVLQNVLVISSSDENSRSVVSGSGSHFTKYFTREVSKVRNLNKILKSTEEAIRLDGHNSNITIYSSYPNSAHMWSWVVNKKSEVYVNEVLFCVVVSPL